MQHTCNIAGRECGENRVRRERFASAAGRRYFVQAAHIGRYMEPASRYSYATALAPPLAGCAQSTRAACSGRASLLGPRGFARHVRRQFGRFVGLSLHCKFHQRLGEEDILFVGRRPDRRHQSRRRLDLLESASPSAVRHAAHRAAAGQRNL